MAPTTSDPTGRSADCNSGFVSGAGRYRRPALSVRYRLLPRGERWVSLNNLNGTLPAVFRELPCLQIEHLSDSPSLWCQLFCRLPAQVIDILHDFTGGPNDGKGPVGALVQFGSSFYGMTNNGGTGGDGTIFRIATNGTAFALMHSFNGGVADGDTPFGTLALSGSTFYGMTEFGGSSSSTGTLFKINADGTGFTVAHAFLGGAADGASPLGSPTVSGSVIYGMTSQGGTANLGTVFKVNTDGTGFTVTHSFTGGAGDGRFPSNTALVISGSTLFGMTAEGGSADQGIVFKMNVDGTGFTVLHSFNPATGDGWDPGGSLTLVGSTLYGMTRQGGAAAGTVFQINTDGSNYNRLHTFAGSPSDGANPLGTLTLGSTGSTFFGTTPIGGADSLGTLFGINADGTGYDPFYSFTGAPNDGNAPNDLTEFGGLLYGTTVQGGTANDGVNFAIAEPEPSSLALLAAAGAAATILRRRLRRGKQRRPGPQGCIVNGLLAECGPSAG
jgi:uncharacterized repeat protein (TIGR03803 family)